MLLVVNTASYCGFTPQYEGLEKLHAQYSARGLVILGFPSGDFGNQEKASNKEIARELDVAESTVKIHVQHILRKLELTSRVQAAVWAVEHGVAARP